MGMTKPTHRMVGGVVLLGEYPFAAKVFFCYSFIALAFLGAIIF